MRVVEPESVRRLFLSRQHLERPRSLKLTPRTLEGFVSDAGGLQLDSINVLERGHYLTLWSRFGVFDKARLDRMVYGQRVLEEYWAHAACLVASRDLPGWSRAMAGYRRGHTGWAGWLKANPGVRQRVLAAIRDRGPLSTADFERPRSLGKASGWWDWKPSHHALHCLWMSGRLAVHSRRHFSKRYDLSERVRRTVPPIPASEFCSWHLAKTFRALGVAAESDLSRYLTFPRFVPGERQRALKAMLGSGEAVEVAVQGLPGRWYCLAEDLPRLADAPESRGTTFLSPFDSLLWHRARVRALFGFDYKIEVYTPAPKRLFGYYCLPILHNGRLIGRLDAKNHRPEKRLEVRRVHFEAGADDAAIDGMRESLLSLAAFLGADEVAGFKAALPTRGSLSRP
ncbi:MAG: crosslink repair DNA glycosylase YcaQ family protein [Elusimicrobiota bacterium]